MANRAGGIIIKGGIPTTRDYLVDGETQIGKDLRKARKANSEIENLALDVEMMAMELAMRRK